MLVVANHRKHVCAVICVLATAVAATGTEIDGFTAPFRSVDVATAETGILIDVPVRVGETVRRGDVLATLDNKLHRQRVQMARQAAALKGRLAVAKAKLALDQQRLEKLRGLLSRGNSHREEVDRAAAEAEISAGQLLSIEEELLVKKEELTYAEVQLKQRTVRSPLNGVVSQIHKDPGEFAGPADPQILTIVQLDPLLAVFSVPSPQAAEIERDQQVEVRMVDSQRTVHGAVRVRSPVIDGRSGTVRVEVVLDNFDGTLLSGDQCVLIVPDSSPRESLAAESLLENSLPDATP